MNALALQSFGYGEQLVRAVEREGVAWFVANDVCAVLEIANPRNATNRLEVDEKDDVHIMDAIGREQATTIISESGVYALIFRSRKPAAKTFRKWVTAEVLPQIRTTGCYVPRPANDCGERLSRLPDSPDEMDKLRVRLQLVREARIAFGHRAARRAWEWCGLPSLVDENERIAPSVRERWPGLASWYDDRCMVAPTGEVTAKALWQDYLAWCRREDERPHSQTAMGRMLGECGHMPKRLGDGTIARCGLTLR